jgi:integration host factor subunit beta
VIKSELIKRISKQRPHLYEHQVQRIVDIMLNEIANALVRGDRVELRGFGTFCTHQHAPRAARNPRTGTEVALKARRLPSFKIGREMHRRLNGAVVGPATPWMSHPRVASGE